MANNSSQSNGDIPFSVDINDYGDADVVAFSAATHKLSKFKEAAKMMIRQEGVLGQSLREGLISSFGINGWWIEEGVKCEILRVGGKDWKKGKLKFEITVKFYPDEPEIEELPTNDKQKLNRAEPSLDDIRRTMNN